MGKLISVSFVFSNNIWVVCSQLLSVEGILFCNGSQNAFCEPWFVKGALFFSRCIAIWSMRIKSIIKNFHKFILRVFTSSASGLRLISLRLRSDTQMVGSKCFMHLNLGLEFWWVGWWRLKFTKIGKWSEISNIVIPVLIILSSSQIFVYIMSSKDGVVEFMPNLVGLLLREVQPQLARQPT